MKLYMAHCTILYVDNFILLKKISHLKPNYW